MSDRVLVTGITGFIARRVALDLLAAGYRVRGTLRSMARADDVRQTLARHTDVEHLEFAEADLLRDDGWEDAVRDCRYVHHLASPFPMVQPKGREALVPAARDGALRVLRASVAAGVERIVLTSSCVAMMYHPEQPREFTYNETAWTDPEWQRLTPYVISKTRAEQAAWEFMEQQGAREKLVAVNPGFVLGPMLDATTCTSVDALVLIMKGAYPAVPPLSWPVVDVRDVSAVHVQAMTQPDCGGQRLVTAGATMSMADMGRTVREAFPKEARKAPSRTLPVFMCRLIALFDKSVRTILPDLRRVPHADGTRTTELTGITFRPSEEAVRATGQTLIEFGVVPAR